MSDYNAASELSLQRSRLAWLRSELAVATDDVYRATLDEAIRTTTADIARAQKRLEGAEP